MICIKDILEMSTLIVEDVNRIGKEDEIGENECGLNYWVLNG